MTGSTDAAPTLAPETPALDALTLEVIWQRLITIMNEVDGIIVRTTFSTILSEGRDFACILTDREGRSLCQSTWSTATFTKVYPRTAQRAARALSHRHAERGRRARNQRPVDRHGPSPGLHPPPARVPPRRGDRRSSAPSRTCPTSAVTRARSRATTSGARACTCRRSSCTRRASRTSSRSGSWARTAACPTCCSATCAPWPARRRSAPSGSSALLDDAEFEFELVAEEILTRSEELMRRKIAELPDGVYEYGLAIDGYIETVLLKVTVEVRGTDVYVDYTGSSPQRHDAAINSAFNSTYATSMYPFKCALAPDVPNNEGLFRPIHVSAPEGSILNATVPRAGEGAGEDDEQPEPGASSARSGRSSASASRPSGGGIWPLVLMGRDAERGQLPRRHASPRRPRRDADARRDGAGLVSREQHDHAVRGARDRGADPVPPQGAVAGQRRAGRHRGGVGQVIAFEHVG